MRIEQQPKLPRLSYVGTVEEKDNEQWSWYKVLDRLSGESFIDMEKVAEKNALALLYGSAVSIRYWIDLVGSFMLVSLLE